ncbi:hypothetical protein DFH06DRAFT_1131127 [Mycena polygramma]|nr:hypothetical protein DFH06DRAFT_1131127 [Mycena polygramma]
MWLCHQARAVTRDIPSLPQPPSRRVVSWSSPASPAEPANPFRCLLNEVIPEVFGYSAQEGLAALCRSSRLIDGLATPLLYRTVRLCEIAQVKSFLLLIEKNEQSTVLRSQHVREFSLIVIDESSLGKSFCSGFICLFSSESGPNTSLIHFGLSPFNETINGLTTDYNLPHELPDDVVQPKFNLQQPYLGLISAKVSTTFDATNVIPKKMLNILRFKRSSLVPLVHQSGATFSLYGIGIIQTFLYVQWWWRKDGWSVVAPLQLLANFLRESYLPPDQRKCQTASEFSGRNRHRRPSSYSFSVLLSLPGPSYQLHSFMKLNKTKAITTLQTAASLTCDVVITVYLCAFLQRNKSGLPRSTRKMMNVLMVNAVNRCSLPSPRPDHGLGPLLVPFNYTVRAQTLTTASSLSNQTHFGSSLASLRIAMYMNSMLATLNMRQYVRDKVLVNNLHTLRMGDVPAHGEHAGQVTSDVEVVPSDTLGSTTTEAPSMNHSEKVDSGTVFVKTS